MAFTNSSKSKELEEMPVSVSVPQLNLHEVVSQSNLLVVAVSQSVSPEPLTPPLREVEPVTVKAARAWMPLLTSKEPAKELEPVLVVETMVRSSDTSLSAQGLVVLTQLPVMVSASESEAGPPAPQSRLMMDSVVPLAVRVNLPGLKFRMVAAARLVAPPSSVLIKPVSVSVSVPQLNLPEVVSQSNLLVVAVSQSVSPEPLTPPLREVEPVTVKAARAWMPLLTSKEPAKELEPVLVVETMVRS